MLANKTIFENVENELRKNGTVEQFEKDFGKIKLRMMVVSTEIPKDTKLSVPNNGNIRGYKGTFDITDFDLVLGINLDTLELVGPVWAVAQHEDASKPSKSLVDFFTRTVIKSLKDGNVAEAPIFSLISDNGDITVTGRPKDEDSQE